MMSFKMLLMMSSDDVVVFIVDSVMLFGMALFPWIQSSSIWIANAEIVNYISLLHDPYFTVAL